MTGNASEGSALGIGDNREPPTHTAGEHQRAPGGDDLAPSSGGRGTSKDRTRGSLWRDPTVRQLGAIFSVGAVIAAAVAITAAYGSLHDEAGKLKSSPVQVRFEWPPLKGFSSARPERAGDPPRTWVNAEIREQLVTLAYGELSENPLDPDALARARAALLRTGWFDESAQPLTLVRGVDNVVTVQGSWRVPYAVVRFDGQDHLVSRAGELLPLPYRPDTSGFKVVVGVTEKLPSPGHTWSGSAGGSVQAGLDVLAFLSDDAVKRQVSAVDVSAFGVSGEIVLITDLGNRIRWGGGVGAFNPGQVRDAVKLQRLSQLHREQGRIDAGQAEIDIRPEGPVLVRDSSGGDRERRAAADRE